MVEMRTVLREVLRRVELTTTNAPGERPRVRHVMLVPHRGGRIQVRRRRRPPSVPERITDGGASIEA